MWGISKSASKPDNTFFSLPSGFFCLLLTFDIHHTTTIMLLFLFTKLLIKILIYSISVVTYLHEMRLLNCLSSCVVK